MKALVTGGGGFLGTRITQLLHARGDRVVVLGRHRYPHHERNGIETIQADIRDGQAVRRASTGVDVVFHTAAKIGLAGPRRLFRDINVAGTTNVIEQCRRNRVRSLVYTSSPSVVFGDEELCGVDESHPYPDHYLSPYPKTKAEAERRVLAANGSHLATLAIRPHLVWGPGDPHLIPRLLARARGGTLIQVGDGRNLVDITYIDDAAQAHLQAADALVSGAPCAGRAYFISQGEPVRLWPWLKEIVEALGACPVTKTISYRSARRMGAMLEGLYWLVGARREPRITRFLAAQLALSHYFDISAARRDLGYNPSVSTTEGMRRLVASYGPK